MDRLNHVKIVTPDPEAVDRFLTEVVEVPSGWRLGVTPAADAASRPETPSPPVPAAWPLGADGRLTVESVMEFRGATEMEGFITGSTESRQFQILRGARPLIWGVAIGTRHLERAHERCLERGIPCTEPAVTAWGDGSIHFFFAEVGGIVFEVMRAEGPAA
jgi:catechol 2,3-dioxygenase-like lactoylglutathione lyase family enzyme